MSAWHAAVETSYSCRWPLELQGGAYHPAPRTQEGGQGGVLREEDELVMRRS